MASFRRRLIAYIIDIVFIVSLLTIMYYFIPVTNKTKNIQTEIDNLSQNLVLEETNKLDFFMEYSSLTKELDVSNIKSIIIDYLVMIIYFIVIPVFTNGLTFGKKIMNIKIVGKKEEQIGILPLSIRSFILNGLGYILLVLLAIFFVPGDYYLSFVTIFAILQVLTLITSSFMIIYRKDNLGLEDILSKSKVLKCN